MMAILEHAIACGHFRRRMGHVFFGVRTLADGFYVAELADLVARAGGNLEVTLALSHAPVEAERHPQYPAVRLAPGMVHAVAAAGDGWPVWQRGCLHCRPAGDGRCRAAPPDP